MHAQTLEKNMKGAHNHILYRVILIKNQPMMINALVEVYLMHLVIDQNPKISKETHFQLFLPTDWEP